MTSSIHRQFRVQPPDTVLLDADERRDGFCVTNRSGVDLYVRLDSEAASAETFTRVLGPNETLDLLYVSVPVYRGQVRCFWAGETGGYAMVDVRLTTDDPV